MIRTLGNEPPILADGRRAPDRREISLRWLSGTFLTGITSSILMGVALFAALDGRQQLAIPAEAYAALEPHDHPPQAGNAVKRGQRILEPNIVAKPADKKIMEVSTMIHDGEKEVVRRKPFAHVTMALAANHSTGEDYPRFDPLAIFSDGEQERTAVGGPHRHDLWFRRRIRSRAEEWRLSDRRACTRLCRPDVRRRSRGERAHQRVRAHRRQHPGRLALLCRPAAICLRRRRPRSVARPDGAYCRGEHERVGLRYAYPRRSRVCG